MKRFNFGDRFISWLQTLYSNAKCSILTNGFQSEYFHISRGIRQGDSLSALLFIIQTEPLAQLIRNDDNIEGLTIINNEHSAMIKGCQFVDDMVTVLKNKQYIMPFLEIVDNYGKVSGAKLNINKTMGIVSHSNLIDDNYGIHMTTGPEKMLGIPVGNQVGQTEFWYALIKKLKARLQIWKSRDLTWEGKSYILKSIGIAQVAYATKMKSPPKSFLSEVNNVIDDFIWNGKKRTVKRYICCLPRQMGGLEIPNVFTLSKAKKILWIIRILKAKPNENWVILPNKYLQCLDNDFGTKLCVLKLFNSSKATTEKNIPKFYKECINDFQELCRKAKIRDDNEIIWHNDFLKFQGESFAFKHWAKSSILHIKDLLKDGTIDEHGIWQKLSHKAGFVFELNKIKKAVPQHWLEWSKLKSIKDCCENDILQFRFQIPNSGIKALKDLTSKDIYNALLINNKTHVTSMHYWSWKFNDVDWNWEHWFTQNFINKLLPRKCKDFNWKIFHGQLNTEIRLSKMKYSDGICKICKNEAENLDHMLYQCGQLEKNYGNMWNLW